MPIFARTSSGNTAVVGARWDDDAGTRSGSAYVFVRGGGVWTQEAKLVAADAAASDYFGDSVVNSMSDIAFMWVGFIIAARAPVWVSVVLFIIAEISVGIIIRDGLVLNVVMLLWPLEAIRVWQAGG